MCVDSVSTRPAENATSVTAYADDEARLRSRLASGRIDGRSFDRRLARCDISQCRGMCCYDGVHVSRESATIILSVVERHADVFRNLGLELPARVIVEGEWAGEKSGPKTAVTARAFSTSVEGYPKHFADTACVFLTGDGRCGLQALSECLGLHPWYYKPVSCWLHPIKLGREGEASLVVRSEETDPYRLPDYPGYDAVTFCGRTRPEGIPAAKLLSEELAYLSRIVGRDLLAET